MDPRLLDNLSVLRRMLDRPVTINSAYRSAYHNARVGGAVFSQHLKGTAADLSTAGQDRWTVLAFSKAVGFTGFGYYNTFLHVDIRQSPAEWGKERWNA